MSRHDRFKNLERERTTAPAEAPKPQPNPSRFAGVQVPGQLPPNPVAPPPPPPAPNPFAPPPAAEVSLELDTRSAGDAPFIRCVRCQGENGSFVSECQFCRADFRTSEQRAYNDQLWRERQEHAAKEAAESAKREAARAESSAELVAGRRAFAEQLARSTAARAGAEFDRDAALPSFDGAGEAPGWKLVDKLPPVAQFLVATAAIGVPLFMFAEGGARWVRPLGFFWLIGSVGLFAPPGFWKLAFRPTRRRWF